MASIPTESPWRRRARGAALATALLGLLLCQQSPHPLARDIPAFCFSGLVVLGSFAALLRMPDPRRGRSSITPRAADRPNGRSRRGLIGLTDRDPDFDEGRFESRVESAFQEFEVARSEHDLDGLAMLVSDGVVERVAREIESERERGQRRELHWLDLQKISLIEVDADAHFDVLTARIRGLAYRVLRRLDDPDADDEPPFTAREPFDVCWTFLRRRGVKTGPEGAGVEGHCPNCQTPVAVSGASARCASCRSWLRSPEYDWVLSEISDRCDWRSGIQREITGRARIARRDPGLNPWHLGDRLSVLFWRWLRAQRHGDATSLASVASRELLDAMRSQLAADGRVRWERERLGDLQLLGFHENERFEYAVAEVRWSATATSETRSSRDASEGVCYLRHLIELRRPRGARTLIAATLSSSHCPSCGAPDATLCDTACRYCGDPLGEGGSEWILHAVHPVSSAAADARLRALRDVAAAALTEPDRSLTAVTLFGWVLRIALADGAVSSVDRQVVERLALHCGISRTRGRELVAAARAGRLDVAEPADRQEAEHWLSLLVDLALEDGELDAEESAFLEAFGRREPRLPDAFAVRALIRRHQHARGASDVESPPVARAR